MSIKKFPLSDEKLKTVIENFPTPFHIYDEKAILENIRKLKDAFSWADFREYFAVKATPNPFIMKLLKKEGIGADCSSLAELILAEKSGIVGENIMFTSNDTPVNEFEKADSLGAVINFDDIEHIKYYEENLGKLPELVCFRYNPGALKEGNAIIGKPEDAKYGFTREQLFEGYEYCKKRGVKRFGIHTMVASNELDYNYFIETANILFDLIKEISEKLNISFEFANLGGGIGIPYKLTEKAVDFEAIGSGVKKLYSEIIESNGLAPLKICLEAGRMVTGPFGYLVSKVVHIKKTYKNYVGLDSSMANLMRPALYNAYHHITVVGKNTGKNTEKEESEANITYDVVGSLCENNDKFAIDRKLPECVAGDILIIYDTGAHGHSMGFTYNGKPRSAELLIRENGDIKEIRRAETLDDLFATLDFDDLENF